jgi:hypothetical protein
MNHDGRKNTLGKHSKHEDMIRHKKRKFQETGKTVVFQPPH